jgi:hypothetical protein
MVAVSTAVDGGVELGSTLPLDPVPTPSVALAVEEALVVEVALLPRAATEVLEEDEVEVAVVAKRRNPFRLSNSTLKWTSTASLPLPQSN